MALKKSLARASLPTTKSFPSSSITMRSVASKSCSICKFTTCWPIWVSCSHRGKGSFLMLQYGRGSLQDCSQPSFHPQLDRRCMCPIITASLSRREWRDCMEICCSCTSPIQAIRALTGDCQVDRLSQGKSFWQGSNGNCLRKRASTWLEHQRLLSFSRCFARQSRVSRNGSRVILLAKWLARSAPTILMAWSSQPIRWRSKQPWSTWGQTPDTIVNHCAAGSVEKQHREQCIPSRSHKAGVHFGKVVLAFSPQRKQASSKPPKWPSALEFQNIQ